MKPTRDQLRQAVKMKESEPHCWHSDDDRRACMAMDHHDGPHDYVDGARIIIKMADLGTAMIVTVRP